MDLALASPILGGVLVFFLRLTDVTLGTMRILMTVRGRKLLAALLGFVEVTIFVVAISQVIRDAGNVWYVLGYSAGFAASTLVGMTIEERVALSYTIVRAICSDLGNAVAESLRKSGFDVTQMAGKGLRGPVEILEVVVRRSELPAVPQIVDHADRKAFFTVEEARRVYRGWRLGK